MTELLLMLADQRSRDNILTRKQLNKQANELSFTLESMDLIKRPANLNLCGRDRKETIGNSDLNTRSKTPIPLKHVDHDLIRYVKVPISEAESMLKGFQVSFTDDRTKKQSSTPIKDGLNNSRAQKTSRPVKSGLIENVQKKLIPQKSPLLQKSKLAVQQKTAQIKIKKKNLQKQNIRPQNTDLPSQNLETWIKQAQQLLSNTEVFEDYLQSEILNHYRSRSAQGGLKLDDLQSNSYLKTFKGITRNTNDLSQRSSITPQQHANDSFMLNQSQKSTRNSITPERASVISSNKYSVLGQGEKFQNFLRKNSGQARGPHMSKTLNRSCSKIVLKNLKADLENNCIFGLENKKVSESKGPQSKHKFTNQNAARSPFGQMSNKISMPRRSFEVIQEQIAQERPSLESENDTIKAEIQTSIIEKSANVTQSSSFWKQQVEKDKAKLEKMLHQFQTKKLYKQSLNGGKQIYM